MEQNKFVIKLGEDREILIKVDLFNGEEEIDVDTLLQIDYANLLAEIATFPVILNKFGLLLADMENKLAAAELDLRIWQAKRRKSIRKDWDAKKIKYNIDTVEDEMRDDVGYKVRKNRVINVTKQRDFINSIYWSAKAKGDNLNKLSLTIQPGDMNLDEIAMKFNGVSLRAFDTKLIK